MENTLKFCVNCQFFFSSYTLEADSCHHPSNIDVDLVSGNKRYKRTPKELRYQINFNNSCGENGLWWKSKDDAPPF